MFDCKLWLLWRMTNESQTWQGQSIQSTVFMTVETCNRNDFNEPWYPSIFSNAVIQNSNGQWPIYRWMTYIYPFERAILIDFPVRYANLPEGIMIIESPKSCHVCCCFVELACSQIPEVSCFVDPQNCCSFSTKSWSDLDDFGGFPPSILGNLHF